MKKLLLIIYIDQHKADLRQNILKETKISLGKLQNMLGRMVRPKSMRRLRLNIGKKIVKEIMRMNMRSHIWAKVKWNILRVMGRR